MWLELENIFPACLGCVTLPCDTAIEKAQAFLSLPTHQELSSVLLRALTNLYAVSAG